MLNIYLYTTVYIYMITFTIHIDLNIADKWVKADGDKNMKFINDEAFFQKLLLDLQLN